uniref:Uncharacterized protein n=1 Tax=Rhizophora mucronata TaxID=61149 RepID=A0A2P2PLT2_RHIMU
MKEIVDWLTALSKLVPLHSWNGLNNPCMMVETTGHPIELRNGPLGLKTEGIEKEKLDGVDAKLGRKSIKHSRRVYSDLGFRRNLMELMAGTEVDGIESDSKSANQASSSSFGVARDGAKGRSHTGAPGNKKVLFNVRRNKSIGDGSELFPKRNDGLGRSSFSAQGHDDI